MVAEKADKASELGRTKMDEREKKIKMNRKKILVLFQGHFTLWLKKNKTKLKQGMINKFLP